MCLQRDKDKQIFLKQKDSNTASNIAIKKAMAAYESMNNNNETLRKTITNGYNHLNHYGK